MPCRTNQPWPLNLDQIASGNPDSVHLAIIDIALWVGDICCYIRVCGICHVWPPYIASVQAEGLELAQANYFLKI